MTVRPIPLAFLVAASALVAACATSRDYGVADDARLRADIAWLADARLEGREPGGPAEQPVRAYAVERMRDAGLTPAFAGPDDKPSWFQPVTMYHRAPTGAAVRFYRGGRKLDIAADQFRFASEKAKASYAGLPIVFLGDIDPERLAEMRLDGVMAMMLAPEGGSEHEARQRALRVAGAAGLTEIVDTPATFAFIAARLHSPGFFFPGGAPPAGTGEPADFISAIMTEQGAVQLVNRTGSDWDRLRAAAADPAFAGTRLSATVSLDWAADIEARESTNIAGLLPGRKPDTGAVLFLAHWDHLGRCGPDGPDGRAVCPGAADNASGVAALFQIADALADERHDRDIYFLLTTGEETGFAGARAFLADPPLAPERFVAILNLDMIAIGKGSGPVAVVGWQDEPVDRHIAEALDEMGLRRAVDGTFTRYRERQDGWVFQQAGLPARMVSGAFGDEKALQAFIAENYHSPADRYSPAMELGNAERDIAIHVRLGRHFADSEAFPAQPESVQAER